MLEERSRFATVGGDLELHYVLHDELRVECLGTISNRPELRTCPLECQLRIARLVTGNSLYLTNLVTSLDSNGAHKSAHNHVISLLSSSAN